ncbi:hydrolase [Ruania halotolerans]|uniref:hydrolase n=1 Tax=Ruania halotolerans TaxID=2897773 RepID=UPI001E63DE75|nr:hydrolase [Ruania halotolerans]UFU06426.1 hydrolase [Ruania halotolerans]
MLICATCAVEYDEPAPEVCPICADERQYLPAGGQRWTTVTELREAGTTLTWAETEPDVYGISTRDAVGIGQTAQLVRTPQGSLLWDPPGFLDADGVTRVRAQGPVLAVAASHPHMFGVQVEWARELGAEVLVAEADADWLGRRDERIRYWSGVHEILPGLTLHQVGGHFAGSAVAHWAEGAQGRGLLLTGDTIFPNPDRSSVGFLRSYPNKIPLSAAVVERIAAQLATLSFDRIVGNFGNMIDADGQGVLLRSAARHAAWVRGEFDHLT